MDSFTRRFTFDLPYSISITEGQVTKDIVVTLADLAGRIIIHPPKAREKRFFFESPEIKIWAADIIEMDVEISEDLGIDGDELDTVINAIAVKNLMRFLRYCRSETNQPQIDLKKEPAVHVKYTDENGQEKAIGYLNLSMTTGVQDSLDDQSWNRVFQCIVRDAQIPFYKEALLDAKLYQSYNDYRMAVVTAAMGIEAATKSYLEKTLRQRLVNTKRVNEGQVGKFIEEISNRLLITVGLGLTSTVDKRTLENCRITMHIRNGIVHGTRKMVSSQDARQAIKSLEELLSATDILGVLKKGRT